MRIALVGEHDPAATAHRAIPRALELASSRLGVPVEASWVGTSELGEDSRKRLGEFAGIWCVPGSPYCDTAGALSAIRYARESGCPFLGTGDGFQHALIEYARSVLRLSGATSTEIEPGAASPLILPLECTLVEQSGTVLLRELSVIRELYGVPSVVEEYRCCYGLNRAFEVSFASSALRFCARDEAGDVRALELEEHPFFMATLFQPERAALRGTVPPLVVGFLRASLGITRD